MHLSQKSILAFQASWYLVRFASLQISGSATCFFPYATAKQLRSTGRNCIVARFQINADADTGVQALSLIYLITERRTALTIALVGNMEKVAGFSVSEHDTVLKGLIPLGI